MPYRNIVFVKLFWKELLHEDDRFIGQLDDDQKGLLLMLFLLAGATDNNIKNDENYIKRTLNLQKNHIKVRENLDKILEVFPKTIVRDGYIKFKNFKRLHNFLRNAEGMPKDSRGVAKIRIDKIRLEYIKIKGFSLENLSSDDFGRTAKAIKILILKANNDNLVIESLEWANKQQWCDWTLETVSKKWADFMKQRQHQEVIKQQIDETSKKLEQWARDKESNPIDESVRKKLVDSVIKKGLRNEPKTL